MSTLVPTIELALDRFVLQLLAKRPECRFPDMGAVIRELSRWEKKLTVVRLRQVRVGAI